MNHTNAWQPTAQIETLRQRSALIASIRNFFAKRGVMEVETPLLCHTSVTDPHLHSIPAILQSHPNDTPKTYFLQTSPEYAMKRLLAAGSGPIYQLSKAFRQEEWGRYHNPEFTMLEWYRPSFDHHALMDEMDELLQLVLHCDKATRLTYAACFQQYLALDPHEATVFALKDCAKHHQLELMGDSEDKDTWLQLLMSHVIEPQIGQGAPCFIYDFPASQAALAKIPATHPNVASRFEVYYRGIELANGFHELQDPALQRKRFLHNLAMRQELGLSSMAIDEYLLAALTHGLPDCAGVALGVDRLVMLALHKTKIQDVLAFDISRA